MVTFHATNTVLQEFRLRCVVSENNYDLVQVSGCCWSEDSQPLLIQRIGSVCRMAGIVLATRMTSWFNSIAFLKSYDSWNLHLRILKNLVSFGVGSLYCLCRVSVRPYQLRFCPFCLCTRFRCSEIRSYWMSLPFTFLLENICSIRSSSSQVKWKCWLCAAGAATMPC